MILTPPIGIDLGTTNSAVAVLDPNDRNLRICRDAQGRATTPSCVWCDPKGGNIVVGHRAFARKGTRPEPVASIKRSMGTRMTVQLGGQEAQPAEVSAHILRELKRQMETDLARRAPTGARYEVSRAIVTVPAYFGLPAIEATREAGKLAGLEVMELLHEPTAAAIYYSWKRDLGDGVYLVYDLGGGTFDVSVLRRVSGEFLVLGIHGDNFLGGDDFDRRLAEHLRQLLVAEGYELDLDVENDEEDQLRFKVLTALAEQVKIALTDQDEYVLRHQGGLTDQSGAPVIIDTSISRTTLEGLIADLLDRTIACCREALTKAEHKSGVTLAQVDHLVLAGGSTYVPAVVETVRRTLGPDEHGAPGRAKAAPIRDDPETAVAFGAALRAAAAGLGIGDPDGRLRLWFRGSGATRRERTTINGHIEPLQPDLRLEGGLLRLSTATGETLGEAPLTAGLRFSFPRVELQPETLIDFRFEVLDAEGNVHAAVQRSIAHAAAQKESVGGALSTAVLSKPILLEGTDGDRVIRHALLAEGVSLPARGLFNFGVTDPSGFVRLPIYQDDRIIKELQADVGAVPIGTPVQVDIACDEQMYIQVRFTVAGREFGGRIEPPPPAHAPAEFEIEQIDRRFADVLEKLDEADGVRLRDAYARTRGDLDEARAGGDYPKVIQRAADLEGLVRQAKEAEPLRPPLETLEQQCARCRDLLPQAAAVKLALAESALLQDLEAALDRARRAYRERDRLAYADAGKLIAAAQHMLGAVARTRAGAGQDVDVAVQAVMALDQARDMTQVLLIQCLMGGHMAHFAKLQAQMEEISDLESLADGEPVTMLNRCQVLITEARRIFQQLHPEQAATDLDGLLRVDAAPGTAAAPGSRNYFEPTS